MIQWVDFWGDGSSGHGMGVPLGISRVYARLGKRYNVSNVCRSIMMVMVLRQSF